MTQGEGGCFPISEGQRSVQVVEDKGSCTTGFREMKKILAI